MLSRRLFALCFVLVFSFQTVVAQSAQTPASPAQPQQPQAPMAADSPVADPAAYLLQEFGPSFKLSPKFPPLYGDLNGDGAEDIVLFATSPTPLLSREQFNFRVEDPYDDYFGTGDVEITSEFTLHFDSSSNDLLIVFGWRLPPSARNPRNPKRVSKFVLINTPMETVSLVKFRNKKKNMQAIEAVDRTTTHAVVFWDGKRWRWSAQGMELDELLQQNRK